MKQSMIIRWATLIAALAVTAGCSGTGTNGATASATAGSPVATSAVDVSSSPAMPATGSTGPSSATPPAASPHQREFLFQVDRYTTANQGGQTLNMYFHYRYDAGIAETDIPNYIDLRTKAIAFMDAVDASQNPYWETLNQQLCGQLHDSFPLEAISCQLQVYPDDRTGDPYEPGFHSSIDTIGDIEPLAIVGPVTTG